MIEKTLSANSFWKCRQIIGIGCSRTLSSSSASSNGVSPGEVASGKQEESGERSPPFTEVGAGRANNNVSLEMPSHDDLQHQLVETAGRVIDVVLRQPRWESWLLSQFSPSHLFHPTCSCLIVQSLSSTKPLLSLRYLSWLSSREEAPLLDAESSDCLLDALADARAWKSALHTIRSLKCQPDPSTLDRFTQRLIRSETIPIDELMKVISEFRALSSGFSPSLPTWNSAISSALKAGRTDSVFGLYDMMVESNVIGNASTAGYLIRAFCKENNLADAYRLLREFSMNGIIPDVASITMLVSGFCKGGNFGRVSQILHLMIAGGCMPDIFTYQTIIHGLCDNGMGDEGFRIFNDLKRRGYAPDLVTYTTMIDGLCKMNRTDDAWKLWKEMIEKGLQPNEYTYNAIMDGYCKAGALDRAQELYHEMCLRGFKESTISCNTLIAGFSNQGRMGEAIAAFIEMPKKGVKHDVITYNTLIQGFCNEGKTLEAVKLYDELLTVNLKPSIATYTPLIRALCKEGSVAYALELLESMEAYGLEPLVCTYDYIITGFCSIGKLEEGMAWLVKMFKNNLKPRVETVNRLVENLSATGQVDDALLILQTIFEIGYHVTTSVYYSIVKELCQEKLIQAVQQIDSILAND